MLCFTSRLQICSPFQLQNRNSHQLLFLLFALYRFISDCPTYRDKLCECHCTMRMILMNFIRVLDTSFCDPVSLCDFFGSVFSLCIYYKRVALDDLIDPRWNATSISVTLEADGTISQMSTHRGIGIFWRSKVWVKKQPSFSFSDCQSVNALVPISRRFSQTEFGRARGL